MDFLRNLLANLAAFVAVTGVRVLAVILILLVGTLLIKWVLKLVRNGKCFQKLTANVQALIANILMIVLYALLVSISVAVLGVSATVIASVIVVAGLALALALQGSLANFAGGFMLLVFNPFSIGDHIDDGKNCGTVKEIGIFYTTLETEDNNVVTIPNGALANSAVINYSKKDIRRLDLKIAVSYNSDIDLVKKTLLDLSSVHDLVLKDPAPFVRLGEQGESALVFDFRIWVKASDYQTVKHDMLEFTKKIFDKRGISIPYAQMDVRVTTTNPTLAPTKKD